MKTPIEAYNKLLHALAQEDDETFHSVISRVLSMRREVVGLRLKNRAEESSFQLLVASGLKNYRLKSKLSQIKLAKLLGVNRHQIIRWESGSTTPNKKHYEDMIRKEIL